MSDDLRQMADGFRLGTAPSDDDVNRANWIIDRQSACIDEIEAERDDLARRVAAYEEMAGMHEPGVLRRQMELRRLRVRAETAEAENARRRESAADPCAALESAVLRALPGRTEHPTFGLEYFSSLAQIAQDAAVDKEAARFACRRLRDKGLAIFKRGLFTEDGEVAGSGYALTDAGRAALSHEER